MILLVNIWFSAFVKTQRTLQHRVDSTVYCLKISAGLRGTTPNGIQANKWKKQIIVMTTVAPWGLLHLGRVHSAPWQTFCPSLSGSRILLQYLPPAGSASLSEPPLQAPCHLLGLFMWPFLEPRNKAMLFSPYKVFPKASSTCTVSITKYAHEFLTLGSLFWAPDWHILLLLPTRYICFGLNCPKLCLAPKLSHNSHLLLLGPQFVQD